MGCRFEGEEAAAEQRWRNKAMKNISTKKLTISYSLLLLLLLLLLCLLLIPLFILSNYAVPSADDFSFSCETHSAITQGSGFFAILKAGIAKTAEVYDSWQGSFAQRFLPLHSGFLRHFSCR